MKMPNCFLCYFFWRFCKWSNENNK